MHVRTRVESETNRSSHELDCVWLMSAASAAAQPSIRTNVFSPEPIGRPPISRSPNVGRVSASRSVSNSQTGKFETVPPSTIVALAPVPASISWTGSKKYGIERLMRTASATLKPSVSITRELPGSR